MKIFTWILLFIPAALTAQQKNDFVIEGYLKGLPEKTEVFLQQDDEGKPVATAPALGGKFKLSGKVEEPAIYFLTYKGASQRAYLYLDPVNMKLNGHKDSLSALRITGSKNHQVFEDFNKTFTPLFNKISQLSQQMNTGQGDPSGKIRKDLDAVVRETNEKTDVFVQENRSSPVAALTILVVTELSEDVLVHENRYNKLDAQAKASMYGKMVKKNIDDSKVGAVGTMAMDFTQNDPDGKPVSLSAFRGKYVLVDFWASWCRPCRDENPNVVEAFNKFKAKNFTVLGVSLDRAREPWLKAIKDDQLNWAQVSDLKFWNNEVAALYKVSSIPQNILVDPEGKIIAKNLRGEELQQRLADLLK